MIHIYPFAEGTESLLFFSESIIFWRKVLVLSGDITLPFVLKFPDRGNMSLRKSG